MIKLNQIKIILSILLIKPIANFFIPLRKYIKLKNVCWFSKSFWNVHDYPIEFGGDGIPSHFYIYKCSNCKKEFGI